MWMNNIKFSQGIYRKWNFLSSYISPSKCHWIFYLPKSKKKLIFWFSILCIPMIATYMKLESKRLLFPIKLVFAITINKSQNQSLQLYRLYLVIPCFSRGQLFFVCSRSAEKSTNVFVYIYIMESSKSFDNQEHSNGLWFQEKTNYILCNRKHKIIVHVNI